MAASTTSAPGTSAGTIGAKRDATVVSEGADGATTTMDYMKFDAFRRHCYDAYFVHDDQPTPFAPAEGTVEEMVARNEQHYHRCVDVVKECPRPVVKRRCGDKAAAESDNAPYLAVSGRVPRFIIDETYERNRGSMRHLVLWLVWHHKNLDPAWKASLADEELVENLLCEVGRHDRCVSASHVWMHRWFKQDRASFLHCFQAPDFATAVANAWFAVMSLAREGPRDQCPYNPYGNVAYMVTLFNLFHSGGEYYDRPIFIADGTQYNTRMVKMYAMEDQFMSRDRALEFTRWFVQRLAAELPALLDVTRVQIDDSNFLVLAIGHFELLIPALLEHWKATHATGMRWKAVQDQLWCEWRLLRPMFDGPALLIDRVLEVFPIRTQEDKDSVISIVDSMKSSYHEETTRVVNQIEARVRGVSVSGN